ncbi:hypothetical protein [Sandarakinorhabdus sp. DWP1-3-1]|uniref:hypothetical protein n=1 Tax=Sandarakinorhabdus sp. DWP1-3-1 TaxID=2804627 RepID=UPI003CE67C0F
MATDNTPDYSALDAMELPGIPTADELRASILGGDARDGLAPHGPMAALKVANPRAAAPGERLTAAAATRYTANRMKADGWVEDNGEAEAVPELAKVGALWRGPADDANPYQRHLIAEAMRERNHWQKIDQLAADLNEKRGFDPETGAPIYMLSETRRVAITNEISALSDEIARIDGPAGELVRQRKLEEAVIFEQRKAKLAYVEREAQKRAIQINLDRQINERAQTLAMVKHRRGE